MASSTKFSEKISLPSVTQQHKLPRFFVIIAFSSNNFNNKNKKKKFSERGKKFLSETYFL
jgi:hypothetical protein